MEVPLWSIHCGIPLCWWYLIEWYPWETSTLEKRAFSFCIISSVSVSETYEEVVLTAKAREIRATHYVHGDSDSPNYLLAQSDYMSQADDESEMMSIAVATDAYHTLEMIEDPNHPILYNRELYR